MSNTRRARTGVDPIEAIVALAREQAEEWREWEALAAARAGAPELFLRQRFGRSGRTLEIINANLETMLLPASELNEEKRLLWLECAFVRGLMEAGTAGRITATGRIVGSFGLIDVTRDLWQGAALSADDGELVLAPRLAPKLKLISVLAAPPAPSPVKTAQQELNRALLDFAKKRGQKIKQSDAEARKLLGGLGSTWIQTRDAFRSLPQEYRYHKGRPDKLSE